MTQMPNAIAMADVDRQRVAHSLVGSCGFRATMMMSNSSTPTVTAMVIVHSRVETDMLARSLRRGGGGQG